MMTNLHEAAAKYDQRARHRHCELRPPLAQRLGSLDKAKRRETEHTAYSVPEVEANPNLEESARNVAEKEQENQ